MSFDPSPIYYVYVLFDAFAIPRWVGKGKGNRIYESAYPKKYKYGNRQKKAFIDRTIKILSEVPQLKIRENLTESEAFEIERLLIKIIGRGSKGPLLNWTDGGEGSSGAKFSKKTRKLIGQRVREWSAKKTPEERSANACKALIKYTSERRSEATRIRHTKRTPKERGDILRKAAKTLGPVGCSERARKANAALTPKERSERARRLHANASPKTKQRWYKALNKNNTPKAQSKKSRAYWDSQTPTQRSEGSSERAHAAWKTRRERYGKLGHSKAAKRTNTKTWKTRRKRYGKLGYKKGKYNQRRKK